MVERHEGFAVFFLLLLLPLLLLLIQRMAGTGDVLSEPFMIDEETCNVVISTFSRQLELLLRMVFVFVV